MEYQYFFQDAYGKLHVWNMTQYKVIHFMSNINWIFYNGFSIMNIIDKVGFNGGLKNKKI